MNTFRFLKIVLLISVLLVSMWRCGTPSEDAVVVQLRMPKITNQSQTLIDFYSNSGDYINAPESPFLIKADEVEAYKSNYLLIDIRYHEDYVAGHIEGAINIDRENLISFLKSFNRFQYEKIIIIDNTGQGASYVVSILRAIGYGNAYALKFGMSIWNPKFKSIWTENIGDKYKEYLIKAETSKGKPTQYPVINTKGNTLSEILEIRAQQEINHNYSVTIESLIENISNYYIVNYWPKAVYDEVHLKGAICYEPKTSMKSSADLNTLPTNKKILIYCYTGQSSSAVAAYLRILGYDAYSLRYGFNSFGHKEALANGWNGFVAAEEVHNFSYIEGEHPSKIKEAKSNKIVHPDLDFKHRDVVQPDPKLVCD